MCTSPDAPLHTRLRGLTVGAWLVVLGLWLIYAASVAAPDLDKTQSLALQRYGARAADTVGAWRRLMEETRALSDQEKLNKVNTFFNRRMLFENDLVVWQQEDYWATPLEFMGRNTGDCEDFAIAKYITLQMLGIGNERVSRPNSLEIALGQSVCQSCVRICRYT